MPADVSERWKTFGLSLQIAFFLKVGVGWLRWVGMNAVPWAKVLKIINTQENEINPLC